jgi:hypothetical protein
MNDQLETMICILLSMIVCQGIQILCQWFIHSELIELNRELSRIANILERMEK